MWRIFLMACIVIIPLPGIAQLASVFRIDTFYLTGHIRHYDLPNAAFSLVKVIYNTPYGQQEQVIAQLDSAGHFKAAVPLANAQELMLDFDHTLIYLYGIPGKDLHLTVDTADIRRINTKDQLEQFHVSQQQITFQGSAAAINTVMNDYMYRLNRIVNPMNNLSKSEQLSASEFMKWRKQKMFIQLDTLRNWKHNLPSVFYMRTLNYIRYSAGTDLLSYWYDHSGDQELPSADYLQFVGSLPVNNDQAVFTDVYYDFLNYYLIYLYRRGQKDKIESIFPYITAQVGKGTGRDLLLANMAVDSLQFNQQLHPVSLQYLRQHIGSSFISERITELYQQLRQTMTNSLPDKTHIFSSIDDGTPDILQTLGAKYKGNVVYIDYWAPWCGPCMKEIQQAALLKKQFINKPVVFLYLAVHSEEDAWQQAIKREQIQGEHYRLSEDEFDFLNKRITITGIPRYMLIDKAGTIIQTNAPRPSQLEDISAAITRLLNE